MDNENIEKAIRLFLRRLEDFLGHRPNDCSSGISQKLVSTCSISDGLISAWYFAKFGNLFETRN